MAKRPASDDSRPAWVRAASWVVRNSIIGTREFVNFAGPRLRAAVEFTVAKRAWIYAGMERAAWWGALALLFVAGKDLLDAFSKDADFARAPYLLGASALLCALVLLRTSARHMRVGSFVLGSTAGALGMLGWLVQYG